MPAIRFDHFVRYAELTEIVHAFAAEHPELVSLESIGKSHEGRDIWLVSVTNRATGAAIDKPAFWVDGNIHSTEVAASAANLYFLNTAATPISPGRWTPAFSTFVPASIRTARNGRWPIDPSGCAPAPAPTRTTRSPSRA